MKTTDNMLRYLAVTMLVSLIVGDKEGFMLGLILASTLSYEETEKLKAFTTEFATNPPAPEDVKMWRDETDRMTRKPEMPASFSLN